MAGQLADCAESIEKDHLRDHLKRVADILGISSPKYCTKFGSKKGDNYVGVIYRILIEGKNDDKLPVKVQVILKVPPEEEIKRQALQIPHLFTREHTFYSEIIPLFEKFLEKKNKIVEYIPHCFLSSVVDHKEVICLEDLQLREYVMRDRMKQMDFVHMSLAFRALGRFHALTFALRDQQPEIFRSKISSLREPLFRPEVTSSSPFIARFEVLKTLVITALSEEDPKYTERFSRYFEDTFGHTERSCDGSLSEPYTVLCHGDFWMNNMLFKYEEDSAEPQEICMVDFQFSRYASPAVDISYTLFCNGSQQLREKHFDELIRIYHNSLSEYLSELGSDPFKLFPYDALLDQLNKFSTYSAGLAMMVLPLFMGEGDDIADLNGKNGDLVGLEDRIHRDMFLKNTLRDTYKDLIDRNYI